MLSEEVVHCCFVEFITYIFADLRNRSDLAFAWMYQEYANMQGYNVLSVTADKQSYTSVGYNNCLTRLLTGLLERPDHKEGSVFIVFFDVMHVSDIRIVVSFATNFFKVSCFSTSWMKLY